MDAFGWRGRRDVLLGAAGGALNLLASGRSEAATPQRSSDPALRLSRVAVGTPVSVAQNSGDNWVAAWADDGDLYSPSNDTSGFHSVDEIFRVFPELADRRSQYLNDLGAFYPAMTPEQKARLLEVGPVGTMAFNRLFGPNPQELDGQTVNWMRDFTAQDRVRIEANDEGRPVRVGADLATWKTRGCTYIDGALYLAIARHTYGELSGDSRRRETSANASLIKSTDHGVTWTRSPAENLASPMFPGPNFSTPYFLEYGRGAPAIDGSDAYVYAVSNNGFWDNGDRLILGRVPRRLIGRLDGADWQFLAGRDGAHEDQWARDPAAAAALVERPGMIGQSGVWYLAARDRYMMITWYYTAGSAKAKVAHSGTETVWDFHEAPKPWGPWNRVGSHTWTPQGFYTPAVCPKFQTKDRVYVFTTGYFHDSSLYHLTAIPLDLA